MAADFTKIFTDQQSEVIRLSEYAAIGLTQCRPTNNNFHSFANDDFQIDFRKVISNGELIGYRSASIKLSPHYYRNGNAHNADQFSPQEAIEVFEELFDKLQISIEKYSDYKVVQMEFGLNLPTQRKASEIVDLTAFYKRRPFRLNKAEHSRISDTSREKQFKVYDKGAQFPQFGENLLRVEIKLRDARTIANCTGIGHIGDLLKLEVYDKFFSVLINDFDHIFFSHAQEYFDEVLREIKGAKNRNKWQREQQKYFKNYPKICSEKSRLKGLLIDTFLQLKKSANSAQRTTINREFSEIDENHPNRIKAENAPYTTKKKVCIITGIDISKQRKRSRFLRENTLREIRDNQPQLFLSISRRYLTPFARTQSEERQLYLICKAIRDNDSNQRRDAKLFQKSFYNPQQLQLWN